MADVFVDSAAVGANDGTTKADAYTTIASTTGAAAGDRIVVSHTHDEDLPGTGSTVFDWTNGAVDDPVRIHSVNFSDDTLTAGATVRARASTASSLSLRGHIRVYGVTWTAEDDINLGDVSGEHQRYEGCTFVHTAGSNGPTRIGNSSGTANTVLEFVDCTFDTDASADEELTIGRATFAEFTRCVFSLGTGAVCLVKGTNESYAWVVFQDCDLTGLTPDALIPSSGLQRADVLFRRCNLKSTYTLPTPALEATHYVVEDCASGTITVPPVSLQHRSSHRGTVKSTTASYREGGADDGEQANEYSWEMATNASAKELVAPLAGPEIRLWAPSGSRTITLYLASAADLDDDEFWVEVRSPSELGTATAQGTTRTTRAGAAETPAALDRSASTVWQGPGTGTDGGAGQQKIDVAIAPTVAGWVVVVPHLAKPSTTVYVDPKLETASLTSTYQRYSGNGTLVMSGNEAGTCDYPAEDDVRSGVDYADSTLTGNLTLPAAEDVETGVQYGANGTEFTGTLDPGANSLMGAGDMDGGFA